MKKVMFLFFALLILFDKPCSAIDHNADELLSWMKLSPKTATQESVTSLLGKPAKIEENKKRTWWYYTHDNTNLIISWNNRSDELEKFSFTCSPAEKTVFNTRLSGKLHSGKTDISQVVSLLGIPKDMTIKAVTQEMHYAYANSVLRLFFRNRTLVDFTLLSQQ